jgi:transposase-like protein
MEAWTTKGGERDVRRDEPAATRFLATAMRRHGAPEAITTAGSAAHAAAIRSCNAGRGTAIATRRAKDREKIVGHGTPLR